MSQLADVNIQPSVGMFTLSCTCSIAFPAEVHCAIYRVTTCLENLEMSGNLKHVREMSGMLLTVRELSGKCLGKNIVMEKCPKTVHTLTCTHSMQIR